MAYDGDKAAAGGLGRLPDNGGNGAGAHIPTPTGDDPAERRLPIGVVGTLAVVAVAAALAVILIFQFVDTERRRAMHAWQARLGIVAESRAAAVEGWIGAQFGVARGLAENDSLRLYANRLTEAPAGGVRDMPEADYIRNLLVVTADRAGFFAPPLGPDVPANVDRPGVAGIALVDADGRILASTPHFPAVAEELARLLQAPLAGPVLHDLHPGPGGAPTMGFVAPILGLQGDAAGHQRIGAIVAIKPVAGELFPLLKQPGATDETAETLIVRRNGAVVEYLSPLADGAAALARRLALETPDLVSALALVRPGGFGLRRDYRGVQVLATSRALAGAPWTLVHKIDRTEALSDSDARLKRLLIVLLLTVALVVAALLAIWRHGASRRAGESARMYRAMAERLERQSKFLALLTDSQPNAIYIVDEANTYRFANAVAAERAGIAKEDMVGKTLASVLGPAAARPYEDLNQKALAGRAAGSGMHRVERADACRVVQSKHVPLAESADMPRGVLVVEEDVTSAVVERERRERILRQLVTTLVTVVDRRDPHAAHHSARVAAIARAVAEEMGLDRTTAQTAATAGELLNLGKILVPERVLTKAGKLSAEEITLVRQSMLTSAELLGGVDFDGPVVETLRQSLERWDGQGEPAGLKGEEILVSARIVAPVNAFVAMTSPRAHRKGLDFDLALSDLMADAGAAYDRKVIAALISLIDNRGLETDWAGPGA